MKLFFILVTFITATAEAYPEMTRFTYNSCTACHVAPSGGGLLTSYGRSLAAEVLSAKGSESEAGFLHGLMDREKLESWLLIGGDIRAAQVHKETPEIKSGRFIKMQADVTLGVVRDRGAVVATFGDLEGENWTPSMTSYYGLWRPRDEISIRTGHFMPQYGVYTKDHISFTRSFLGFGLGGQRDVLEAQWTGETWTTVLSTTTQFNTPHAETAWTGQVQYFLFDRSKLALNYWRGSSDIQTRDMYGTWWIIGFSPRLFWIHESDWQSKNAQGLTTQSFVTSNKWGYTLTKGLDALAIGEYKKSDLSDTQSEMSRYGLGLQFYPRPHFEISGAWTRQKALALYSGKETDYAWFVIHYYL